MQTLIRGPHRAVECLQIRASNQRSRNKKRPACSLVHLRLERPSSSEIQLFTRASSTIGSRRVVRFAVVPRLRWTPCFPRKCLVEEERECGCANSWQCPSGCLNEIQFALIRDYTRGRHDAHTVVTAECDLAMAITWAFEPPCSIVSAEAAKATKPNGCTQGSVLVLAAGFVRTEINVPAKRSPV